MEEIRKDIKGYEGIYQISSEGRYKILKKTRENGWFRTQEEIIGKQWIGLGGYLFVVLNNRGGGTKSCRTHRLVAEIFIPNPENKKTVNHKNGITTDNRVENLERMTYSENCKDGYNRGRIKIKTMLGKISSRCILSKKVKQMDLEGNTIKIRDCGRDIYRELGIAPACISNCCRGKYKKSGGFKRSYFIQ